MLQPARLTRQREQMIAPQGQTANQPAAVLFPPGSVGAARRPRRRRVQRWDCQPQRQRRQTASGCPMIARLEESTRAAANASLAALSDLLLLAAYRRGQ